MLGAVGFLCTLNLLLQQTNTPNAATWKAIDSVLGRSGNLQGETYRVGFPRSDLHVTVGAVTVRPSLVLGSWVAFKQTDDSTAMLMGDLVLLPIEATAVIDALQRAGIEQTALHNHLTSESPHVVYLHINGRANGGVYQVSIPRAGAVTVDGAEVPPAMGVATAINFQAIGATTAAATGDFVLIASEVNPVLRTLRTNGIAVTALHSHMLNETPRLFFMHFWGEGDALKVARGLRAALDEMNIKRD
jgi:hypothetical protein